MYFRCLICIPYQVHSNLQGYLHADSHGADAPSTLAHNQGLLHIPIYQISILRYHPSQPVLSQSGPDNHSHYYADLKNRIPDRQATVLQGTHAADPRSLLPHHSCQSVQHLFPEQEILYSRYSISPVCKWLLLLGVHLVYP